MKMKCITLALDPAMYCLNYSMRIVKIKSINYVRGQKYNSQLQTLQYLYWCGGEYASKAFEVDHTLFRRAFQSSILRIVMVVCLVLETEDS